MINHPSINHQHASTHSSSMASITDPPIYYQRPDPRTTDHTINIQSLIHHYLSLPSIIIIINCQSSINQPHQLRSITSSISIIDQQRPLCHQSSINYQSSLLSITVNSPTSIYDPSTPNPSINHQSSTHPTTHPTTHHQLQPPIHQSNHGSTTHH